MNGLWLAKAFLALYHWFFFYVNTVAVIGFTDSMYRKITCVRDENWFIILALKGHTIIFVRDENWICNSSFEGTCDYFLEMTN